MAEGNNQGVKLIEAEHLSKWFPLKDGIVEWVKGERGRHLKAVDDVSLAIYQGENMGLVGESGCGKSTLARTLIRLYEPTDGVIRLDGQDITHLSSKELRPVRPKMQMIFQDPYSSLNPRMSVYDILSEVLTVHNMVPRAKIEERVYELMEMCGLTRDVAGRFPGEFSGGQRQRIGIARSLALEPKFVIADEPVSALDVSIQAQIINLLEDLQKKLGLTLLFISHDLRVVRHITKRLTVMYLGTVVELGDTQKVFEHPMHPYTRVLTKAAPGLDPRVRTRDYAIEGETPSPIDMPTGCRFHPRCPLATEKCRADAPPLTEAESGRFVACHRPLKREKTE